MNKRNTDIGDDSDGKAENVVITHRQAIPAFVVPPTIVQTPSDIDVRLHCLAGRGSSSWFHPIYCLLQHPTHFPPPHLKCDAPLLPPVRTHRKP